MVYPFDFVILANKMGKGRNETAVLPAIPITWKEKAARWVEWPIMRRLMLWGIRAVVPRHRIGVALVAFNEADQVLMLRHVFHPITPWGVPGGWLGGHESPADGVLRELREETGLSAVLAPAIYTVYDPYPPHIGIMYLGYIQPGPFVLSAEIIEAAWFSPDELPGPMLPHLREAITRAAQLHQQLKHTSGNYQKETNP